MLTSDRYVLNYKGLPYKTEWVEYPDIADVCKRVGAGPTAIRRDGTPYYTAPILYDPLTDTYVSDSLNIALHLERVYTDTRRLFPPGTEATMSMFHDALHDKVLRHIHPLMMARTHAHLNPRSAVYFRRTREAMFKAKLEDLAPQDKQEQMWKKVRTGLGVFDGYIQSKCDAIIVFMGDGVTYADVILAGWLCWVRNLWGKDEKEWKEIVRWHGGRWGRIMAEFEKWEQVEGTETPKARFVRSNIQPIPYDIAFNIDFPTQVLKGLIGRHMTGCVLELNRRCNQYIHMLHP